MTKEELKEQDIRLNKLCFDYQEKDKIIKELEEKISILLSCKKCPENKGGYICAKEYENKCLAQKIQFIKELQEENAELEKQLEETKLQNAISEEGLKNLIAELERKNESLENVKNIYIGDLLKAKEIIRKFVEWANWQGNSKCPSFKSIQDKAEQFLNSEVEK